MLLPSDVVGDTGTPLLSSLLTAFVGCVVVTAAAVNAAAAGCAADYRCYWLLWYFCSTVVSLLCCHCKSTLLKVLSLYFSFIYNLTNFQTEEGSDEESDEEDSDEDLSSSDEEDSDAEELDDTVCPPGCDQALFDQVCQLRENRLDLEEELADEKKASETLKKEYDALVKKAKVIDSALNTAEADLEAFQVLNDELSFAPFGKNPWNNFWAYQSLDTLQLTHKSDCHWNFLYLVIAWKNSKS